MKLTDGNTHVTSVLYKVLSEDTYKYSVRSFSKVILDMSNLYMKIHVSVVYQVLQESVKRL